MSIPTLLDRARQLCDTTHDSIRTTHKCWGWEKAQPNLSDSSDPKALTKIRQAAHLMSQKTAYQFYALSAEIERVQAVCHALTSMIYKQSIEFCNKTFGQGLLPEESRPIETTKVAINSVPEDGTLFYQVKKLAAARFGYGDQSEASLAAWGDASGFSAAMRLKIQSKCGKKSAAGGSCYHIVILHPSSKTLWELNKKIAEKSQERRGKYSTIDVLNNLPRECIVLDPVMKVCCVGEKMKTEGEILRNYIINRKLCYPVFATILEKNADTNMLTELAKRVLENIQGNISKISYNPLAPFYVLVEDYVRSSIKGFKGATFQGLEEAFPGTKWSYTVKGIDLSFATDCNEEQKNKIAERPTSIPHSIIRIKENRYIVTIPDGFCVFKDKVTNS